MIHNVSLMVNHQSTCTCITERKEFTVHCYVNKVKFQAIFLLIYLELKRKWRVKNRLNTTNTTCSNHLCVFITNMQTETKIYLKWKFWYLNQLGFTSISKMLDLIFFLIKNHFAWLFWERAFSARWRLFTYYDWKWISFYSKLSILFHLEEWFLKEFYYT